MSDVFPVYSDTDFIIQPGISLHVPLPMNVAKACYHSLLGDNIFWLLTLHVSTNAWVRRPVYQAQGGAMLITGSCTVGPCQ